MSKRPVRYFEIFTLLIFPVALFAGCAGGNGGNTAHQTAGFTALVQQSMTLWSGTPRYGKDIVSSQNELADRMYAVLPKRYSNEAIAKRDTEKQLGDVRLR
jgi:hypothetical protein